MVHGRMKLSSIFSPGFTSLSLSVFGFQFFLEPDHRIISVEYDCVNRSTWDRWIVASVIKVLGSTVFFPPDFMHTDLYELTQANVRTRAKTPRDEVKKHVAVVLFQNTADSQ